MMSKLLAVLFIVIFTLIGSTVYTADKNISKKTQINKPLPEPIDVTPANRKNKIKQGVARKGDKNLKEIAATPEVDGSKMISYTGNEPVPN